MASAERISTNDARILDVLQRDGRRPYAELGADVGMSGPSAHERVKKLEGRGVITGYAAIVDPRAIGYDILAFSWITQAPGTVANDLSEAFAAIPEIEECHHVTGEADYLINGSCGACSRPGTCSRPRPTWCTRAGSSGGPCTFPSKPTARRKRSHG